MYIKFYLYHILLSYDLFAFAGVSALIRKISGALLLLCLRILKDF